MFGLLTDHMHGHGFTVSTIEEVYTKVDYIYAVKVLKVLKPEKEYTGKKPYSIEFQFKLVETLKGSATTKTRAIYTLPAIERELDDGTVMRVWLKVMASGKEMSVKENEEYLIYADKYGVQGDETTIIIVRIDPISKRKNLVKLLELDKKSQQ